MGPIVSNIKIKVVEFFIYHNIQIVHKWNWHLRVHQYLKHCYKEDTSSSTTEIVYKLLERL
jgi:hypothetical protein